MTKSLLDTLNLPSLEEVLGNIDAGPSDADDTIDHDTFSETVTASEKSLTMLNGTDHGEAMNVIHDESLKSARDLNDLGFNMDHARARGIFEQSANFYKIALDAKNAKRDAELKAMKLKLESEKMELAKKMAGDAPMGATNASVTIIEDRNEMIRRLRGDTK